MRKVTIGVVPPEHTPDSIKDGCFDVSTLWFPYKEFASKKFKFKEMPLSQLEAWDFETIPRASLAFNGFRDLIVDKYPHLVNNSPSGQKYVRFVVVVCECAPSFYTNTYVTDTP